MQFQKGDRVRVVKDVFADSVPVGALGTVEAVKHNGSTFGVQVDGHPTSSGGGHWNFTAGEIAPEPTVKELVEQALERVRRVRGSQRWVMASDISRAPGSLEDGLMRFTRGMAMRLGVFSPADLEKIGDDPTAAPAFLAERDQKAADAAREVSA